MSLNSVSYLPTYLFLFMLLCHLPFIRSGDAFFDDTPVAYLTSPKTFFNLVSWNASTSSLWSTTLSLSPGLYRFQALLSGVFQDPTCWEWNFRFILKPPLSSSCAFTWVTMQNGDIHHVTAPFGILAQVQAEPWLSLHQHIYFDGPHPTNTELKFEAIYQCTDTEKGIADFIYLDSLRLAPILNSDPPCGRNLLNFTSPSLKPILSSKSFLQVQNATSIKFQPTQDFTLKLMIPINYGSTYDFYLHYSSSLIEEPFRLVLQTDLNTISTFTLTPGTHLQLSTTLKHRNSSTLFFSVIYRRTLVSSEEAPELLFHHISLNEVCNATKRMQPSLVIIPQTCITQLSISEPTLDPTSERRDL